MAKKYNCVKNGIKYFRKTKTIGHKSDGTPIRKEFYGDGEKDCDKQIECYMDSLKSGLNVNVANMTVKEGMSQWLFDVLFLSKNQKSASFEKHESNYRIYIKGQKIGSVKIQSAATMPFQKYYNDLFSNGLFVTNPNTKKKKHIKVSSSKISDLNKSLRAFFNWCIKQRYTLNNPCSLNNIEIPGNADGEEDDTDNDTIQIFNDDEIKVIMDNIKFNKNSDNTYRVLTQLDLITGLRLGELLGLKKKFISEHIVKIRNTLKRLKVFDSS